MSESDYYLAFSLAPGIGPKRFRLLIEKLGSAQKAWGGNKEEYLASGISYLLYKKFDTFRKSFDIQKYKERLEKEQVEFIAQNAKDNPWRLKNLDGAPIGLFGKGNIFCLQTDKSIGVVGTRKVTSYGKTVTESLVSSLVSYGFTIVSGLALGVDSIAHKTAIDCQGPTLAVLGCGVDCCYPLENQKLYDSILSNKGLIVSEYPLGTQPSKGTFPARNRIIAALSIGVLVTEAGADSGSLITADYAIKQNKKIFAVPGPITSRQSDGTSYLIKNGAKLVQNVEDVLEALNLNPEVSGKKPRVRIDIDSLHLSKEEKEILEFLMIEPHHIDDLAKRMNIKVSDLLVTLSDLEVQGLIKNIGGGIIEIIQGR